LRGAAAIASPREMSGGSSLRLFCMTRNSLTHHFGPMSLAVRRGPQFSPRRTRRLAGQTRLALRLAFIRCDCDPSARLDWERAADQNGASTGIDEASRSADQCRFFHSTSLTKKDISLAIHLPNCPPPLLGTRYVADVGNGVRVEFLTRPRPLLWRRSLKGETQNLIPVTHAQAAAQQRARQEAASRNSRKIPSLFCQTPVREFVSGPIQFGLS
jgi:hypothetical protein